MRKQLYSVQKKRCWIEWMEGKIVNDIKMGRKQKEIRWIYMKGEDPA